MGRPHRLPGMVLELLRLCCVLFCAGVGYQVGSAAGSSTGTDAVLSLGPFGPVAVGVLLGTALGYVLGGVLARTTLAAVVRTERALTDVPAEHLVAGVLGAVVGSVCGLALSWPLLLVAQNQITVPIVAFVGATTGLLGYRVGVAKRDGVLRLLGPQAGIAPRGPAVAALPRVLDSSVAIDGRIVDVVRAGFLAGPTLVPLPVLEELQGLADAGDDLRRARGRRGLEAVEALRRDPAVDLQVIADEAPEVPEVDAKLVRTCLERGAALLTLDTNLAKAASLAGVRVQNLHALALALRPPVVAGDEVGVLLLKPGKEAGQAVGYLDDGTMVVVERARGSIGAEVPVVVTSVLTTANGRMVFAKLLAVPHPAPVPHPPAPRPPSPAAHP
ncbi:MAG TPA: hypothetical protein VFS29_01180 [Motilibacteraceae bacterium]|nr:hypothetical protein [Motilibacteraceae bacterium]